MFYIGTPKKFFSELNHIGKVFCRGKNIHPWQKVVWIRDLSDNKLSLNHKVDIYHFLLPKAIISIRNSSFFKSWNGLFGRLAIQQQKLINLFVQISPWHCERNSCHNVRRFQHSFRFVLYIVAHNVGGKSKNLSMFAFNFSPKFWTFY